MTDTKDPIYLIIEGDASRNQQDDIHDEYSKVGKKVVLPSIVADEQRQNPVPFENLESSIVESQGYVDVSKHNKNLGRHEQHQNSLPFNDVTTFMVESQDVPEVLEKNESYSALHIISGGEEQYHNPMPHDNVEASKLESQIVGEVNQSKPYTRNNQKNIPHKILNDISHSNTEKPEDSIDWNHSHTVRKGAHVRALCRLYTVSMAMCTAVVIALSTLLAMKYLESSTSSIECIIRNTTNSNALEELETFLNRKDSQGYNISALLLQYLSKNSPDYEICSMCSSTPPSQDICIIKSNIDISGGEWVKVADIDMTKNTSQCPLPHFIASNRSEFITCRSQNSQPGCYSAFFTASNMTYSKVYGRIKAYQYNRTNSFYNFRRGNNTINDPYVDGVSLTYGQPRQHIWTFASDLDQSSTNCPCGTSEEDDIPDFVGEDYFCDSGLLQNQNYTAAFSNPLWDGERCGCNNNYVCCNYNQPPWFYKQLQESTSDPIELRVCRDQVNDNEDILLEVINIYIHA